MFAFSRPTLRLAHLALLASVFATSSLVHAQQPRGQRGRQLRQPQGQPQPQPGGVITAPLARRAGPPPAPGATFRIAGETDASQEMQLEIGRSRVVHFRESIIRVSIVDPEIADLRVITP